MLGTACVDRICTVPHLPAAGGYVEVTSSREALGGEAANTAVTLLTWGADVQLVCNRPGRDSMGSILQGALEQLGWSVESGDQPTPVCTIYVTADGDRTMFGEGFSALSSEPLNAEFAAGTWVTADPNFREAARTAIANAQQAGAKTYLMDFLSDEDRIILANCDVWQSSTDWLGSRGDDRANRDALTKFAEAHGIPTAILTDGRFGAHLLHCGKYSKQEAPACGPIVDATGAGDSFRAGVLLGLAQNRQMEECVKLGSAAGCLNGLSLGATLDIPRLEDVMRLAGVA